MDFQMLWQALIDLCLPTIVGAIGLVIITCGRALTDFVAKKTKNETVKECLKVIDKHIAKAVVATNQTFVDAQKQHNTFNQEAMDEAFAKTKENVMTILTDTEKEALQLVYRDINIYIDQSIEAMVKLAKEHPEEVAKLCTGETDI